MLSDDHLELTYGRDAGFIGLDEGRSEVGLLMTEDNSIILQGTVEFPVLEGIRPLEMAVGGRLFMANLVDPDDDVMGIGFGASARYRLPTDRIPLLNRFPFHLAASIYYSPEVTTSGAGVDILDIHVIRGELELAENVYGLIGLRTLEVDRDDGDEEIIDERVYVGLRVVF